MGKRFFLLLVTILILTSLSFAAGEREEEVKDEVGGSIILYTSVPQLIVDKIQEDFGKKFPSITLDVFRSGTSSVVAKLMTEKEAGSILADLVWVAEPSTYEDFKKQNLLYKFTPEEAKEIGSDMKDPEGYYYAGRLINMIIAYNTLLIKNPPQNWKDVLDSNYKLGFPTPLRSGAAVAAVKTLIDRYGWEYFEQFKSLGGKQIKSNSTVRDMIVTGELNVGIMLDYMVRPLARKGSPINYVWPKDGAVFIPSPIAILNSSKNKEAAEVFVNYILSVEGQRTLVETGSFIPVREDVTPPEGAPTLDKIQKLPTDWKKVKEERQNIKDRWMEIFGG
ncbi:MAG: extracellular solute-binding protein [Spirochaetaceae bacterium]|nr:extracellular solute-binding protein [Spirochaetaceae bacterium]